MPLYLLNLLALPLTAALLTACGGSERTQATLPGETPVISTSRSLQPLALVTGDNYLSAQTPSTSTNGYGPYEVDRSNGEATAGDGKVLTLNGTTFSKGLGVHASSQLVYGLAGQCMHFTAQVGVDDEVGASGSVTFQVFVDGEKQFDSGVMTGSTITKSVNVRLAGAKELKLVVTDGGDGIDFDHGDWADAKLTNCAVTYSAPIIIKNASDPTGAPATKTVNGVRYFTGAWESTNPATIAVQVQTSEPVVIENSFIRGPGELIRAAGNVTVRDSVGYGVNPNINGQPKNRFFKGCGITKATIENNYLEGTTGIIINGLPGCGTGTTSVKIRYNQGKNIDGRRSNGSGGYQTTNAYIDEAQFIQLNGIQQIADAEIAWNSVLNEPYVSALGDTITLHNSSGISTNPIIVHDNLVHGAYGLNPAGDFPGGGILLGDSCDNAPASQYESAYGNTVLETSNYGIAIANGRNESISNNIIVGTGQLEDGTLLDSSDEAGIYMRNVCNASGYDATTITAQNNTVGWGNPTTADPANRNDVFAGGGIEQGTNHVLPYTATPQRGIVSSQRIKDEVLAWQQRAATNNIVVGPH